MLVLTCETAGRPETGHTFPQSAADCTAVRCSECVVTGDQDIIEGWCEMRIAGDINSLFLTIRTVRQDEMKRDVVRKILYDESSVGRLKNWTWL